MLPGNVVVSYRFSLCDTHRRSTWQTPWNLTLDYALLKAMPEPRPAPADELYELSLGDLVSFAQEGWHYPLEDDEETRTEIRTWLRERAP